MNNDLEQFSEERLKKMTFLEGSGCVVYQANEVAALARIALAAKQAMPVGYISERNLNALGKQFSVCVKHEPVMVRPIPLYTTPQPAHTEQDGWIKCSDQLPPDDDFVLIWPLPDFGVDLHVGQYCECHPKGDGWYAQVNEQNYGIEWYPINVTHWMSLPKPPVAIPKPESE